MHAHDMPGSNLRELATNAIAYWEPRRILYNAALLAVVVATYSVETGTPRRPVSFETLQQLFLLSVLANVAYCAVYPPDLLVQFSGFRTLWLRVRWGLLLVGMLFASVLAHFISRGIFWTGN
jgi:hypothetical protein